MSRYSRISVLKHLKIVGLRAAGYTHAEIAQKVHLSLRTIARSLQSSGKVKHHPDIFLHGNIRHVVAKKLNEGFEVGYLARQYGVTPDTIARIASLNNIPVMSPIRFKAEIGGSLIHNNYHKSKSKRRLVVESRRWHQDSGKKTWAAGMALTMRLAKQA